MSVLLDCAIIGGGPAGLNAALVLGRARRKVVLFDNNKPRNAVTQESHGFVTRDGVTPTEFRRIAQEEIEKYPSVEFQQSKVAAISKNGSLFRLTVETGETFEARNVILATGLKETLPEIRNIHDFYGKSLFNCPYCDGWELRDRPLVVVAEEGKHLFHMAKVVANWSRDLVVSTNGRGSMMPEQKQILESKGIRVLEQEIREFVGRDGQLEQVIFADGTVISRTGGFVAPQWSLATSFGADLGCAANERGGIVTDVLGRTSVQGVYAAGEGAAFAPSNLIGAAAAGSMAAAGVNTDLTEQEFAHSHVSQPNQ
jgi:thioredoxin reductase